MRFLPFPELPEVIGIVPEVFGDDRGFFMETFQAEQFHEAGIRARFVQENHSLSAPGVLRGLHFQHPGAQGKLVRVIRGSVFDVAVDIREGSPTFGRWVSRVISAENKEQLWVPPDFAHGFAVLDGPAELVYKCTALYRPETEAVLGWNDPAIGIDWPIAEPTLSDKDQAGLSLAELAGRGRLPEYRP